MTKTEIATEQDQEFSIIGKMTPEEINLFTPALGIRNDCQQGKWKIGDNIYLESQLEFGIIKIVPFKGKLGKSEGEWMQLWIVPAPTEKNLPKNVVAVTYIKTRSMSNLGDALIMAMQEGDPGELMWQTDFIPHAGEYGQYFSIAWGSRKRKNKEEMEQLDKIIKFLKEKPRLVDSKLPETMLPLLEEA